MSNLIRTSKTHQLESVIEMGQSEGMISMKKTLEWLLENDLITPETAKKTLPAIIL